MADVAELFGKIDSGNFGIPDARELIKSSYYLAATHSDVHIVLSLRRPADFHFQHLQGYEERAHSMFPSMDEAGAGIAAALNYQAGKTALRFLSVSSVNRITILSRSGAGIANTTMLRSAIASGVPELGRCMDRRNCVRGCSSVRLFGTDRAYHGLSG